MSIIETKKTLLEKLLAIAEEKELTAKKISTDAQHRANEEEGAMQSRYSTFKEEGQYVAGGLKLLHEELRSAVAMIRTLKQENIQKSNKIATLAIFELEFADGTTEKFFMLPALAGEKVDGLTVVTPTAPLAKSVMGKQVGDEFKFSIAGKVKSGEIIFVG